MGRIAGKPISFRTEVRSGVVTFLTMSYIIFVQPVILSQAGMDFGAVLAATCISAAAATLLMGLLANYPIALAPGMGENFFFAYTVVLALKYDWRVALGAVFIAGIIFLLLTFVGVREALIDAVPEDMRRGIAAGIGLFIVYIGLKNAGIVIIQNNVPQLGPIASPPVLLALLGFVLILLFNIKKIKGGVLWAILIVAVITVLLGYIKYEGILDKPPSISPTFLKLNIKGALVPDLFAVIFIFLFMDVFDTMGTLLGVAEYGGFIKDGKIPRANKALLADAVGTVIGATLGTSTVTSYIESVTGIEEGGRTGLTAVVVALLFLTALFFMPLVKMVGTGISVALRSSSITVYPATAGVLMYVGLTMLKTIRNIDWSDITNWVPAIITAIAIPLSFSIADGMALGFILLVILKMLAGKFRDLNLTLYLIALIFIFKFVFVELG